MSGGLLLSLALLFAAAPSLAATTIYLSDTVSSVDPGADDERYMGRLRGSSEVTYTKATVDGTVTPPTAATQFTRASGGTVNTWYSDPLDAVTISGDITFNLWSRESATQANATITAECLRADGAGNILSTIATVLIPRTELTTTLAAENWARTPALTSLSNGDRLALRVYIDDGNGVTMSKNRTVTMTIDGASGGASGDSWMRTTEDLAPARPATGPVTEAFSGGLTAAWSLVDGATGYLLAASVNSGSSPSPVASSSETVLGAATTGSLGVNTTYYLFVRTNGPGASSSWSSFPATATLANQPSFSGFSGVGTGAVQLNWSANGNPASVTRYRVLVSTAPDPLAPNGAAVSSSDTYDLYLATSGLVANTTYYFVAAAINHSGIASSYTTAQATSTLAAVPVPAGFSGVSESGMLFDWASGGNPQGTLYLVLSSTAPDPLAPSGAAVASSYTYSQHLSTVGLAANVTHYFRVAGLNNNGIIGEYSSASSTATIGKIPAFSGFSGATASALTFGWTANGNPGGTLYRVLASTAPDPLFPDGAMVSSSDTYSLSLSSSGLPANTAYYFRAASVNRHGVLSGYSGAQSAYTLAFAPSFSDFYVPSEGVVRADWSLNGNPPGTLFRALVSTAPDPSEPGGAVVSSSDTYNLSLSSSGLLPNVTYYFRLAGINNDSAASPYGPAYSTSSLAVPPSGFDFIGVSSYSARLSWGEVNGPGALYRVAVSTAPDPLAPEGASATSADTYDLYLSSVGLQSAKDYYFRVAAANNNGLWSGYSAAATTRTLAAGSLSPPVPDSLQVHVTSITASWLLRSGTTGYTLAASVNPGSPPSPVHSSSETLGELSATLSVPPFSPDTVYYLFVRSNGPGASSSWTDYPPVATLLSAPPLSGGFSNVAADALDFNWSANGNAYPGTLFRVLVSTAPDPLSPGDAVVATSDTYNISLSSAGLAANSTYYFSVAGINKDGVATAYTSIAGTSTLAAAPEFSGFSGIGTGTIGFVWSAPENHGATLYRVFASTASDPLSPEGAVVSASDTYATSLSSSGIPANTAVYFRAAAYNNNGVVTAYTSARGTSTLANAPSFYSFSEVGPSSARFAWSAPGNHGATVYRVLVSTAPDPLSPEGAVVTSSDTYGLSLSTSGLNSDTRYYFRAAAANNDGVLTAWTGPQSTVTLTNAPVFTGFTGVTSGEVKFNWSANGDPEGTLYRVLISTSSDPFSPSGAAVVSSDTYNTYLSTAGLFADTTYYFTAAGVNSEGSVTAWTPVKGTATLVAYAPVFVDFTDLSQYSVRFNWSDNGNPDGTLYRVYVSTAPDPLSPAGAVYSSSETYDISLATSGLTSNTTYYFRVAAINKNGIPTEYTLPQPITTPAAIVRLYLRAAASTADPDASEEYRLSKTRGALLTTYTKSTVAGAVTPPTSATQFTRTAGGATAVWYTGPLGGADISGSVVFNLWARESATQANATVTAELLRADKAGNILSVIASVLAPRAELTTTLAAQNWTRMPVPTSLSNGDRLALRVYIDDGNGVTMASGRNVTMTLDGPTAGISGDSWIQLSDEIVPAAPVPGSVTGVAASQLGASWQIVEETTGYTLAASVNPGAEPSPIYASSDTLGDLGAVVSVPALNPNTTYYLFVRANDQEESSAWTAYAGTSTLLAYAPVASGFSGVWSSSGRFNWSANGNPAGTRYRVLVSTAADPLSPDGAVVTSSYTYNAFLSTSGLNADATYYFRVAGVNNNEVPTEYTAAQGTATLLAFPPVFSGFTSVYSDTIRFDWSANGNVYPGTRFRVLVSTAPDPLNPGGAAVSSSDTYKVFLDTAGLSANTTYYFRAAGINKNGVATAYTASAGTATLANQPASPVFIGVGSSSIAFSWTGGNPQGTLFRVVSSTAPDPLAPDGAAAVSSDTYELSLSTSGLAADTTYYFRVAAVNRNGVATAYTAPAGTATLLAYAPSFTGFSGVGDSGMQAGWSANGNAYPGTLFRVVSSTAPDPLAPDGAVTASSYTYDLSLSLSELSADTTYYFRVAGLNKNGVATAYTVPAGTATLAVKPEDLYATGVTTIAVQVNWPPGGNAPDTLYRVLSSTATDPLVPAGAAVVSSDTYNVYVASSGLTPSTDYYFRAAAVNKNRISTSYSPPFYVRTLATGEIGSPANGVITSVAVSSIAAAWDLVSGATGYTLAASLAADNPPVSITASSATIGGSSAAAWVHEPGLVPDTMYYLFARANGDSVSGAWFAFPPAATLLAFPPEYSGFGPVTSSAARFDWSANGNAYPGTLFRVLVSTAPDPLAPYGAAFTSSDTYNAFLSTSGLFPDTTYYFRVAGVGKGGVLTAYTVPQATATWADAPIFSGFSGVGPSSAQFNWSSAGNPYPGTRYRVVVSTAEDPLSPGGATATSSDTYDLSFSSSGLVADTTYYFRVSALGRNGASTAWTATAATSTLLAYPPVFTGFGGVGTSSMTFSWSANGNASPGSLYRVISSTAPDPLAPGGAVAVSSLTYSLSLSSSGLARNTTYYFAASGVNKNGVETAYSAAAGSATLAGAPASAVSTFSAVSATGFKAHWSAGLNPADTLYQVQVSTAQDFNAGVAEQTVASTAALQGPAYTFTGLAPDRLYYFRVRAENRAGIYTPYAELGSTRTAALPAPSLFPVTAVSTYSITAAWNLVTGATGYTLAASVNPGSQPSPVYASSVTAGAGAEVAGLALNATYYLFVRAEGPGHSGSWAVYPATSTLANRPSSAVSTFSAVTYNSFSVAWNADSNPLGSTLYTVEVSTAPDFNSGVTDQVSFSTAPVSGPGAAFTGLSSDTYYYFRVRAANNNGTFTDWTTLGFSKTLALPVVHAAGDGMMIYGKAGTSTPQFRHYYSAGNNFSSLGGTLSGPVGSLFVIKPNPLSSKQEAVAGYVKSGILHVLCTDGANWYEEWTQAVGGDETTRRFDIAFEKNTGDAMVLYSQDVSGTNELGYRTKSGSSDCGASSWSAGANLDPQRTSGAVQWVKMASDRRASSGTIAAIWADSNSDLSAMVWDGNAWQNEPSASLETSLEVVSSAQDVEDFDVEFESLSGDIMVVWANSAGANGTNGVRYATATWTGGTPLHSWGNTVVPPTFSDDATNLDLAANPNSNEMIFASVGNAGGAVSSDMQIGYWSGSAWSNTANVDVTCQMPLAGDKLVAAGWLTSGSVTRWVVAYNDATATNIGWYYGTTGSPTAGTDSAVAPAFGSPQRYYAVEQDPVNKDRLMLTVSDGSSALYAKRLVMTSVPAFTWSDANGGAALESSLASATVSGFSFAFWGAPPSTTFEQSAYRFFANTDTADVGEPLAAQNTLASLSASGSAFRLRTLLHIGQVALPVNGKGFRLQFAGRGNGTCAAPANGTPDVYTDVGADTVLAFNDNTPADNTPLITNPNDPAHGSHPTSGQTYEEANNSTNTVSGIPRNEDGMWDFALKDNGLTPGAVYCLRLVKSDGLELESYSVYPQFIVPAVVYLNEVYPSGVSASEDWVELYNNTTATTSLLGWTLKYVESTIALGGTPNTVWTGQPGDMVNAMSTFTINNLSMNLNGGQGYHVKLENGAGTVIDQVQWPGPGIISSGQSFARIRDGDPFFFEIDPTPTKGYPNYVGTDTIKLNEISYGNLSGQFAEFYNTSSVSTPVLSGYSLRNSVSSANGLTFKFTRKIFPLGYTALDFSSVSGDNLSWTDVFGAQGLSAAGDFLTLENSTGATINTVTWQSGTVYTRYDYAAALSSFTARAPSNAVKSIIRGPSEGSDTGNNSLDFYASAYATLASRNNGAALAAANTLIYPQNDGSPQYLARKFPIRIYLGENSYSGGGDNLVFVRTGGSADTHSPHVYRLGDIGFDLGSLAAQSTAYYGLSFYDQDGYPLVSSASYRITFNSDTGSASAPQITIGTATFGASIHQVTASTVAPRWMNNDARAGTARLDVSNNNPAGFNLIEMSTVSFRLLNSAAEALTTEAAVKLFNAIMIVRDSTSGTAGVYEPGIDVSTAAYVPMAEISLDAAGFSTLTVTTQGRTAASVPAASTGTFYIVLESTRDASESSTVTFRMSLAPGNCVTIRDGPGELEQDFVASAQVLSSSVTIIAPAMPPAGSSWPYVTPSSAVISGTVSSYSGAALPIARSYIASEDGYLRAVSVGGELLWSFAASPLSPIYGSPSEPQEEAGAVHVYFANDNGDVYKVRDNGTGATQIWKRSFGSAIRSNIIVSGTRLYFGASDNKMHCIDRTSPSGADCAGWIDLSVAGVVSATPFVDDRTGVNTAWVGTESGSLIQLNTGTGGSAVSFPTGSTIKSSPFGDTAWADSTNRLFITSTDGKLYVAPLDLGSVDQPVPAGAPIYTSPFVWTLGGVRYVFYGDDAGKMHKVSTATWTEPSGWPFQAGGAIRSSPVLVPAGYIGGETNSYVYFGCEDSYIYAVNANSGVLRSSWPVVTGGPVRADPVIDPDNRTLTVGSTDGRVYTLDIAP